MAGRAASDEKSGIFSFNRQRKAGVLHRGGRLFSVVPRAQALGTSCRPSLSWPKFSRGGGDERVSLADFSSAGCETPKVGFVRVRLAGNCQRLALVWTGLHF